LYETIYRFCVVKKRKEKYVMSENKSNMPFNLDNHLTLSEGSRIKHVVAVVSGDLLPPLKGVSFLFH